MQPLFQDELQVVLDRSRVLLAHIVCDTVCPGSQRRRCSFYMADCDVPAPGAPVWSGALAALERTIDKLPATAASVRVVLSDLFVTYSIVPWRPGLNGESARRIALDDHFLNVFGDAAKGWVINASHEREGHPLLACAVDSSLLMALRTLWARYDISRTAVLPHLSSIFNRYRHRLIVSAGWIVSVEANSLCVGLFDQGGWILVNVTPFAPAWQIDLATLLERYRSLANSPCEANRVFLWAPEQSRARIDGKGRFHIWRLDRPTALFGPQWLRAHFDLDADVDCGWSGHPNAASRIPKAAGPATDPPPPDDT